MAFHNVPPNGFPDLPDVEELEAVQKDVKTLKTTTAEQGAAITNLNSTKANQITIAPFFSAETAYDPGDLVYYNGLSYRCVNAHEGEWDADDFAATTIANELDELKSGLNYSVYGPISTSSNFSANLCKVSNIAFLGVADFVSLSEGETILTGKIPVGYRPKSEFNFTLIQRNLSHRPIAFSVRPNGDINIYNYGSVISSATSFGDTLSWPIGS